MYDYGTGVLLLTLTNAINLAPPTDIYRQDFVLDTTQGSGYASDESPASDVALDLSYSVPEGFAAVVALNYTASLSTILDVFGQTLAPFAGVAVSEVTGPFQATLVTQSGSASELVVWVSHELGVGTDDVGPWSYTSDFQDLVPTRINYSPGDTFINVDFDEPPDGFGALRYSGLGDIVDAALTQLPSFDMTVTPV